MRSVRAQVRRIAPSSMSVLLQGETGTGKEVCARSIHLESPRRERPFTVVDCGSLSSSLIQSELFGHERGAFTGAEARRAGAFELADGGTLLLDEVGELPLSLQPALLGVLERRRFQRLGGDAEIETDVRVIAASNRDLQAEVARGNFRADLYYRLAGVRLHLPPLRERPEDIAELVEHLARRAGGALPPIDPELLDALEAHPWEGNVRELRNFVEAALATGELSLEAFGVVRRPRASARPRQATDSAPGAVQPYGEARALAIRSFQRHYLAQVLRITGGSVTAAARLSNLNRSYLTHLLRELNLRPARP